MQKITPYLWFNDQAEAAVKFYTSIFKNSKIENVTRYEEGGHGPKGQVMTASFKLLGQDFVAMNGGPEFSFTPATSFFVNCQTQAEIDMLWEKLCDGGMVLMELGQYPFSEKFGWLNDRYGVSWQLNLATFPPKIIPYLLFVGDQVGKAAEAVQLYTSIFENSSIIHLQHYGPDEGEPEGHVKHAAFLLDGQEFMAMDSSLDHQFTFTPAVSYFVSCRDQAEVDFFWEKLSEGGEKDRCGWLKDRFGVSWQVIPTALVDLMNDPDPEKARRVAEAMLQMNKIEIEKLQQAYEQG